MAMKIKALEQRIHALFSCPLSSQEALDLPVLLLT
ncbi:hypothetical protein BJP35_4381 [Enterobacter sp. J49]|nr:hypothetical protein BJP35_4381 [Enterobacter sp. J49]